MQELESPSSLPAAEPVQQHQFLYSVLTCTEVRGEVDGGWDVFSAVFSAFLWSQKGEETFNNFCI